MVRESLLQDVRTAIMEAKKREANVRKDGLRFRHNGETKTVNLEIIPIRPPLSSERVFMVLFEEPRYEPESRESQRKPAGNRSSSQDKKTPRQIARLKQELEKTRAYLQATIEEQEATNEELRSANEEIQSANEELQSTNEELETAMITARQIALRKDDPAVIILAIQDGGISRDLQ
jgi:two-component system CheB/CheR fusion protein